MELSPLLGLRPPMRAAVTAALPQMDRQLLRSVTESLVCLESRFADRFRDSYRPFMTGWSVDPGFPREDLTPNERAVFDALANADIITVKDEKSPNRGWVASTPFKSQCIGWTSGALAEMPSVHLSQTYRLTLLLGLNLAHAWRAEGGVRRLGQRSAALGQLLMDGMDYALELDPCRTAEVVVHLNEPRATKHRVRVVSAQIRRTARTAPDGAAAYLRTLMSLGHGHDGLNVEDLMKVTNAVLA